MGCGIQLNVMDTSGGGQRCVCVCVWDGSMNIAVCSSAVALPQRVFHQGQGECWTLPGAAGDDVREVKLVSGRV